MPQPPALRLRDVVIRRRVPIALLLITLLAALIRFFKLSTPCLWYDEVMVYWRTCGSYGQLLQCLRTDGFVPLHYEANWVIGKALDAIHIHGQPLFPTPFFLRLISAVSGTLMAPAIYFLARQMLPVRTSLVAALLAATSAFLIFYSRDAKMYMDGWLLVTLATGSMLWWFRCRGATAWLCWVAAGAAAVGVQASSLVAVAVWLLFLFTQRSLTLPKFFVWLLGVIVIVSGPVGYYEKFNTWQDRTAENWHDSGLEWVSFYNSGRTGPDLYRFLGSTYLTGWEWPKSHPATGLAAFLPPPPAMPAWKTWLPKSLTLIVVTVLVLAALPWPRHWRQWPRHLESVPSPGAPDSRWRASLWLGAWLLLPVYGFYCRSMPGFASPLDWWQVIESHLPRWLDHLFLLHKWPWVALAVLAGAGLYAAMSQPSARPYAASALELAGVGAILLVGCEIIYLYCHSAAAKAEEAGVPWQSVWVPRYIGVVFPAGLLIVASLLQRLPVAYFRWTVIAFVVMVNIGLGSRRFLDRNEPPVDRMAADEHQARLSSGEVLNWPAFRSGADYPGTGNLFSDPGQYYLLMLDNARTTPAQFKGAYRQMARKWSNAWSFPRAREIPAGVKRIIVWNEFFPGESIEADPPRSGWKLSAEDLFYLHDFWQWTDIATYRRQVWVRQPAAG